MLQNLATSFNELRANTKNPFLSKKMSISNIYKTPRVVIKISFGQEKQKGQTVPSLEFNSFYILLQDPFSSGGLKRTARGVELTIV